MHGNVARVLCSMIALVGLVSGFRRQTAGDNLSAAREVRDNPARFNSAGKMLDNTTSRSRSRSRGPNWTLEETMILAESKREAFLNKEEGQLVWERISRSLLNKFPDQFRSAKKCRQRWETLVRDFYPIENYCREMGVQDHRELGELVLNSLRLPTTYHPDWYSIVKEVCSQSNRRSLVTTSMEAHHEQSTTVQVQVSPGPSSEVGRLRLEEEVQMQRKEIDALKLKVEQLWQYRQLTQQDQIGINRYTTYELATKRRARKGKPNEPQQGVVLERVDGMAETSLQIEHVENGSEFAELMGLLDECPGQARFFGATNVAGSMSYDSQTYMSNYMEDAFMEDPLRSDSNGNLNMLMSNMNLSKDSATSLSPDSNVSEGTISRQSSGSSKTIEGLDTNSDLQSVSKEEQQSQRCAPKVIELKVTLCSDARIRRLRRKLEEMDGVEKPVIIDMDKGKVSVTATAKPEDILKQVRMVKKDAVIIWP